MAVGLGENSPIVLQLTRDNFNGIIKRHGQYVRWLKTEKCPCVGANQRVNENCLFCKGKGVTYKDSYMTEEVKNFQAAIDNVIMVPNNDGIIWVRDMDSNELPIIAQCSEYVTVGGIVRRGQTVTVKYRENFLKTGNSTPTALSANTFLVDLSTPVAFGEVQGSLVSVTAWEQGRVAEKAEVNVVFSIETSELTDTIYPTGTIVETAEGLAFVTQTDAVIPAGDTDSNSVVAIAEETGPEYNVLAEEISVINPAITGSTVSNPAPATGGQNEELTVSEIHRNTFTVEETPSGAVTAEYEYMDPFLFAILNQNLSDMDKKWLVDNSGDAIMIFPQKHDVTEGDIVVALNSHSFANTVLRSTGGTYDSIPAFYPYDFSNAFTYRNGVKVEFVYGTDFIVYSANRIKWISGNKPTASEQVSLSYSFFLTYKVLKDIPSPRSSENNRFPRKVALKVYTDINPRETI